MAIPTERDTEFSRGVWCGRCPLSSPAVSGSPSHSPLPPFSLSPSSANAACTNTHTSITTHYLRSYVVHVTMYVLMAANQGKKTHQSMHINVFFFNLKNPANILHKHVTLLTSFFPPSHLSFKNMYIYLYTSFILVLSAFMANLCLS